MDIFGAKLKSAEAVKTLKNEAVEEIIQGRLTLLNLVELLGPRLTDKNEETRADGVWLLSDVLDSLPRDCLDEEEIRVLVAFFLDRLQDHYSLKPATFKGLLATISMGNYPESLTLEIMGKLNQEVTCQSEGRLSRYYFYKIMHQLMLCAEDELLKKSNDYVYAVISAMESEGDPRNLVFLFNFLPVLLSKFRLNHLAEEAFAVLECYFPVDFTEKSNFDVKRDDLARGLEQCLSAAPDFGPFAMPMILEKLDSGLKVAQVDSLKLMIKGFQTWNLDDIDKHTDEVWIALGKFILPVIDTEVANLAVTTLEVLCRKYALSPVSKVQAETFKRLLNDITSSAFNFLRDPTLSLFLPSANLLGSISKASDGCCEFIVIKVVPQLMSLLEGKHGKDIVLAALNPFLKSSVQFDSWKKGDAKSVLDRVPEILTNLLDDPSCRQGALVNLQEILPVMDIEIRGIVYGKIIKFLVPDDSAPNRTSCSSLIQKMAAKNTEEVKNALLNKITLTGEEPKVDIKKKVDVVCWCCNVVPMIPYCSDKIILLVTESKSPSCSSVALSCFRDFCESTTQEDILRTLGVDCRIVDPLLNHYVNLTSFNDSIKSDLENVVKIFESVIRIMSDSEQNELIDRNLPKIPVDSSLTTTQVLLLKSCLVSLRQNVQVPNRREILTSLTGFSLNDEDAQVRRSSSVLLGSMVNKCPESDLDSCLNEILTSVESSLSLSASAIKSVDLLSWLTKSLLLRGHRKGDYCLKKLIELLRDDGLKLEASSAFKLLLEQTEELSVENYCTCRILFKQKIYEAVKKMMNDIVDKEDNSAIYLTFCHVLSSMPRNIIISDIQQLMKVIILCIECDERTVVSQILDVVTELISSGEKIFESHADTFINQSIKCCSSDNMNVLMRALECLCQCGKFEESKILPYRPKVISEIQKHLDHKKRLVRQKAVKASTRWFLVGSSDD